VGVSVPAGERQLRGNRYYTKYVCIMSHYAKDNKA
jgi:hypothetical protein